MLKETSWLIFYMMQHVSHEFLLEPEPLKDIKAKAVDEMMDRIKKGIILRPVQKIQVKSECLFYALDT